MSTGQVLRETKDKEVLDVLASGALVNDELVVRIVGQRLKQEGYDKTFLLDGFPRNQYQAKWITEHGDEVGKHIKAILFMDVSEETAHERLGDRGRNDDNDKALAKRQEEQKKLAPMIEYLKDKGIPVETIDANRSVEEIFESIKNVLARYVKMDV